MATVYRQDGTLAFELQYRENCIFIQLAPILGCNKYHFVFIK